MRFGYGESTGLSFGAGVESVVRRNLSGRLYLDLAPANPGLALGADLLFKPNLAQYNSLFQNIFPYFGGGLSGVLGSQSTFGVGFSVGLEGLLDSYTGLFVEGQYVYGFADAPKTLRAVLGVNFH